MESEHNKLDKLEENIYGRTYKDTASELHTPLTPTTPTEPLKPEWNDEDLKKPEGKKIDTSKLFKKVLIGSIIFFVLALAVSGFIIYRGLNVISNDKINITFVGPAAIGASQELDFDVVVDNKNRIPMANTKVYIDFPVGTKDTSNVATDLLHQTVELGDIAQKTSNRKTIKAILFGKEHEMKQVKVTIEYGVKNNNAVFRKEALYTVQLSSVPVQMTISGAEQVLSGDEVDTTVTLKSNSNTTLSNIVLKADYPFGYAFLESTPQPTYEKNMWVIKTLKPGQTVTYQIKGRLEGQELDERSIHFTVGSQSNDDEKTIATLYLDDYKRLIVNKSSLQATLFFNDQPSNPNTSIQVGTTKARISVNNTTSNPITNVQVKLSLSGNGLNPNSVVVESGSYNQATKTIIWNPNFTPGLANIGPGSVETLDFSFSTLSPEQAKALQNGSVVFNIVSTGTTYDPNTKGNQTIAANLFRTTKLQSTVTLAANAKYSVGPFTNSGPIPPRVNNKTTYTVTWIINNSTNPVTDAQVQAVLPSYVKWVGKISPSSENITWNSNQNAVVWRLGTIAASAKKEGSFQIELDPELSQLGSAPVLVKTITFTGTDSNTTQQLTVPSADLTTQLSTDPKYATEPGIVQN